MQSKVFNEKCPISPDQLFQLFQPGRRGHSCKLFLPRTRMEIRKRFFSVRVTQTWNSLPEETISSASLDIFKGKLQHSLGQRLFEYQEWSVISDHICIPVLAIVESSYFSYYPYYMKMTQNIGKKSICHLSSIMFSISQVPSSAYQWYVLFKNQNHCHLQADQVY